MTPIFSVVALSIIFSTFPSSQQNIKFYDIHHEYRDQGEADKSLADKLHEVTGYPIVVDSFDSSATWHASNLTDCAEQEVEKLLSKIRGPDGSFTREYKMSLNEHFSQPSRVEVEWVGACENIGRKRDLPASPEPTSTVETSSLPPVMPTTTPVAELPPPTTTTELPQTTLSATTESTSETITSQPFSELDIMAFTDPPSSPPPTTATPTTAPISTAELTTTTKSTDPPTSPASDEPRTTTIATTTTITTTTTESEAPISRPLTTTTEIPTTTKPAIESAPIVAPDNAASSAKYIGLGAAFGLSIVYLICARAYRRQGMYELNTET